jgi:hypothetical protein
MALLFVCRLEPQAWICAASPGLPDGAASPWCAPMNYPPPIPSDPSKPAGICGLACFISVLALGAGLPLLWWRMTGQTAESGEPGALAQAFGSAENAPAWYVQMRAGTVIAAFLALVLAIVGLIMGKSGRVASISMVLALAALVTATPGLGLVVLAAVLVLVVLALVLGIG